MPAKITLEDVLSRLSLMCPEISLDTSTYKSLTAKARFIDPVYGEWWATPKNVLNGRRHPDGKASRIQSAFLEKYGCRYALSSPEVREKIKETSRARYGVDTPIQDESIRKRANDTLMDRYGVRVPSKNPEISQRIKETNISKYGTPCVLSIPEVKERAVQNLLAFQSSSDRYESSVEKEIRDWIVSLGLETKKTSIDKSQIDIFIDSLNMAIECNGLYWHSEQNGKYRNYHLDKTRKCQKHGIRLIHIWDYLWIHRKEQVKSFLISAFGLNAVFLMARKCSFRSIQIADGDAFLDKYHIQGKPVNTLLMLGAFSLDGELVSVASFGRHHRDSSKIALTRFVTKTGTSVSGALGKFSKLASLALKTDLVTWADCCLSVGRGYLASGWILSRILPPDYFYSHHGNFISKQSQAKKRVGAPEGMTEKDFAESRGLFRVWDCGKMVFTYPYCSVP